jgi:predicted dehydrogenase
VDRPLRIGVLGTARITATALVEPARALGGDVQLAAVASRDAGRATAYAAEHGFARAFRRYQDLIDDPDLDAIYNPLPNNLHAPWSVAALAAGKAVLCEKPMALDAEEAAAMTDAARRSGRPLVEAFHYRYHPLAQRVVELVGDGAVGRVRAIDVNFWVPAGLVAPGNIRFHYELGGGATMDLGCYCINALRLLAGGEPTVRHAVATPYAVVAGTEAGVDRDIDVAMTATLELPGGAVGHFDCSLAAPRFASRLRVVGDDGEMEVMNLFHPQRGNRIVLRHQGGEEHVQELEATPTFRFQLREFVAAVLAGGPVRTPPEDAVANMAVIDAVYRAAGMRPRRP